MRAVFRISKKIKKVEVKLSEKIAYPKNRLFHIDFSCWFSESPTFFGEHCLKLKIVLQPPRLNLENRSFWSIWDFFLAWEDFRVFSNRIFKMSNFNKRLIQALKPMFFFFFSPNSNSSLYFTISLNWKWIKVS